ncbi:MAG: PD40 domain-containing protein, partial [Anaerolineae bacterium]|nr:PD40 domain-containing protein [Anaerolineae bacterium]
VHTGVLQAILTSTQEGPGGIGAISYSPDGRWLLSLQDDRTVTVWDVDTQSATFGEIIQQWMYTDYGYLHTVLFGADNQSAYVTSDNGTVLMINVFTGDIIREFGGADAVVVAIDLSPDNRHLLGGTISGALIEWDVETGQETRQFTGQPERMVGLRYSPDGHYVFVGSLSHATTMYELATGKPIRHFAGIGVLISPDGRYLFNSSDLANVNQWRIDTLPELLDWTRANRYVRDLTCEERAQYRIEPLCEAGG